tara:strand:- start:24031 stop:29007 length:4977 start_codon:yes stop_codon:yes gene_type:complete
MARKIWKISDFSGGLNSYDNSYDIESSEFAEFQNITSVKPGIAKPLGSNIKDSHISPLYTLFDSETLSSIMPGKGFFKANTNYTYHPADSNENLTATVEELEYASTGWPVYWGRLSIESLMWVFETSMPTSGTLTLVAQINGVNIMEPITMLAGNWISELPTTNKFGEKWFLPYSAFGDETQAAYHYYPDFYNLGIANYATSLPYNVHNLFVFNQNAYNKDSEHLHIAYQAGHQSMPQALNGDVLYGDIDFESNFGENPLDGSYNQSVFFDSDYYQPLLGLDGCSALHPSQLLGGNFSSGERFALGPFYLNSPLFQDGILDDDIFQNVNAYSGELYESFDVGGISNGNSLYHPAPNTDYFGQIAWNFYNSLCASHHWKLMIGSISHQIIRGVNNYDFTIVTVDDLTPSHTQWQAGQSHTNITGVSNGAGIGLTVNIATGSAADNNATFTIVTGGKGYAINEEITFTDPGSTSETAVLIVNSLGGTALNDSYEATFTSAESNGSVPHYSTNQDTSFGLRAKTAWEPDDNLAQTFSIKLTSSGLGDTGSPVDNGTPAQVAQYSWVDSLANVAIDMHQHTNFLDIASADLHRFAKGELIRIDNEIMLVEGVAPELNQLHVRRGSNNYYGIPASSRSGMNDQFVTHSSGTDIYKDALSIWNENKFSDNSEYIADHIPTDFSSYMTGTNVTNMNLLSTEGTILSQSPTSKPPHKKIRLTGQNITNDGIVIRFTFNDPSKYGITGVDYFDAVVPMGSTDSYSEIINILAPQIGTIKVSSGDSPYVGVTNLAMGYNGGGTDSGLPGGGFGDIYFTAVDTSKTMVINSNAYTLSPAVPESQRVNTLETVTITSGMDDFSVGDYVCWQKSDAQAVSSSSPGIKELAIIRSKSGAGSSGTIVIDRAATGLPSSDGFVAGNVFTKCRTGVGYEFSITCEIIPGSSVYNELDYRGDDEIFTLLSKSGETANQLLPSQQIGKKVELNVFSKSLGTWVITDSNTGYNLNEELNWVYGDYKEDDTNPLIWNESDGIRLCETNFSLPNKNKIYTYINISNYFQDLPNSSTTHSTYNWPNSIKINGWMLENSEIKWDYSVLDDNSDGDDDDSDVANEADNDTSVRGLSVSNDAAALAANIHGMTGNISDDFARMYLSIVKTSGGSSGIDWGGYCKFYATAVYKDGSETLPIHKFDTDIDFGELGTESLQISVYFRPSDASGNLAFNDKRITGIRLYYTHENDSFVSYNRIGTIDFTYGFLKSENIRSSDDTIGRNSNFVWKDYAVTGSTNALYLYNISGDNAVIQFDSMPVEDTYEMENLFHPSDANSLNARYKAITIAGGRSFIGNISINDGYNDRLLNDTIIVSPFGKYDVHPYPGNRITFDISDGDEIIALASIGEKVLEFKKRTLYILDISTNIASQFSLDSKHKFKGIMNNNHFCYADNSVFWFNHNSAYLYDGEEMKDLFVKGGEIDEDNNSRISNLEWNNFISEESMCGFNPTSKEIFVIKSNIHYKDRSLGDCYVYNIISDSWSFGKEKFWCGKGDDLTFNTTTPTPNTAWAANQLGDHYIYSSGTSGNGTGIIITATTNHLGNPTVTLVNAGSGYKKGDSILFYDPEFILTGNPQTVPSIELVVNNEQKPKFITNIINFGDRQTLGFLTSGNGGDAPGPDGDGSPV